MLLALSLGFAHLRKMSAAYDASTNFIRGFQYKVNNVPITYPNVMVSLGGKEVIVNHHATGKRRRRFPGL